MIHQSNDVADEYIEVVSTAPGWMDNWEMDILQGDD
jgi:hypothetical protein